MLYLKMLISFITFILIFSCDGIIPANTTFNRAEEKLVEIYLKYYDKEFSKISNEETIASWNYVTNLTDYNRKKQNEANTISSKFIINVTEEVALFKDFNLTQNSRDILKNIGKPVLPLNKQMELNELYNDMSEIYGTAEVCLNNSNSQNNDTKCSQLDPDLTEVMSKSTDFEKLKYTWKTWRDKVGTKIRPFYKRFIDLLNEGSRIKSSKDYGHSIRMNYKSETFEEEMLTIYDEIKPLYQLLHSYIRRKLHNTYGSKVINLNGSLPACVLGDMWGRFWTPLYSQAVPYPQAENVDIDKEMLRQNYNISHMFQLGEDYFTSMGLNPLPENFYDLSMLERPTDGRKVICHPTAWDFHDKKDYRIKMCTSVNFENLLTIHHELGHIQYFQEYSHLPIYHRDGANGGFHEAIGELMSMTMSTPQHLAKIGLLPDGTENKESMINFLLRTSLNTISTLPFHLVNDLWIWKMARNEITEDQWNHQYWVMKEKYLGVVPPVNRTENHLDPLSIYHLTISYPMINYFTRTILQFQMADALCKAANHTGPLHTCDIYGSKEAGFKLASMLKQGSSRHWKDVLEEMTGSRTMDSSAILRYFNPLTEWLKDYLNTTKDTIGWETQLS